MSLPVDDLTLTERAPGLWSMTAPFTVLGARFGRRMVVLSRNGVTGVFSPNRGLRSVLTDAFDGSFAVDYLVAPTMFHDTFFDECARDCPKAKLLVSEAFPRRNGPDAQTIGAAFPDAWQGALTPFPIGGMPRVQETVFYDRESESLLVSDLMFFFDGAWDAWTRGVVRCAGMYGKPRLSRLFRSFIKDRDAFRRSLRPLMDLPVRRILPSHGKAISAGGSEALKDIYEQAG